MAPSFTFIRNINYWSLRFKNNFFYLSTNIWHTHSRLWYLRDNKHSPIVEKPFIRGCQKSNAKLDWVCYESRFQWKFNILRFSTLSLVPFTQVEVEGPCPLGLDVPQLARVDIVAVQLGLLYPLLVFVQPGLVDVPAVLSGPYWKGLIFWKCSKSNFKDKQVVVVSDVGVKVTI